MFVRRDGHVPPLQPLYHNPYAVLRRFLHHFTLRIGDREDKMSTQRLKPCTDPTVLPAQLRTRGHPPAAVFSGFSPAECCGGPQGTFHPAARKRTVPGTVSPWPADMGF